VVRKRLPSIDSNGMLTLNNKDLIGESAHWALCRARHFDTSTRRFQTAGIEISDGRIAAISDPGESGANLQIDGSGMARVSAL